MQTTSVTSEVKEYLSELLGKLNLMLGSGDEAKSLRSELLDLSRNVDVLGKPLMDPFHKPSKKGTGVHAYEPFSVRDSGRRKKVGNTSQATAKPST